jgi:dTDP-4-amino-4,6-dideoxygalactose transaminase
MDEFEAACLLGQLPGVMDRHYIRNRNAKYLTEHLKECPGLVPQKLYPGPLQDRFTCIRGPIKRNTSMVLPVINS